MVPHVCPDSVEWRGQGYAACARICSVGRVSLEPEQIVLGKYRIERIVGQGGMGTVVCARHLSLDEVVAIKVLNSELGLHAELAQRFTREARAAARLRSRHAVRVTDVGQLDDGRPYMVMEMLEGSDLAQMIRAHGALDVELAVRLVLQACEVLGEAHALGIVHRDIKPSNLFVITGDDGAPFLKLLDFGIAKAPDMAGTAITRTLSILGTPGYMSPEQLRSARTVDHRADLWALGAVLYELLEGRRAFDADNLADLCTQITTSATPPLVRAPPALARVVMQCLEKAPEHRPGGVDELVRALMPFSADPASAARRLGRLQHLSRIGAERSGEPPSTPLGRLSGPTEALIDAAGPAVAARLPFAPSAGDPITSPRVIAAGTSTSALTSPRARPRRRGARIAISTAVVVAVGITLALQLRADRDAVPRPEASPTPPPPIGLDQPRPRPPEAPPPSPRTPPLTHHDLEEIMGPRSVPPGGPPAHVKPLARAVDAPAVTPTRTQADAPAREPPRPAQRKARPPSGSVRGSAAGDVASSPKIPPAAPASDGPAERPPRGDGTGSAPCDPYSRLGC
jgi:serine/threonine protein kinase